MNCPKCKSMLEPQQRAHVTVDVCAQCRGMWLEAGELEELLDSDWPESGSASLVPTPPGVDLLKGRCPSCEGTGKLVKVRPPECSRVLIDMCKVCHGVWLDAAELELLKRDLEPSNNTGLWGLILSIWTVSNQ